MKNMLMFCAVLLAGTAVYAQNNPPKLEKSQMKPTVELKNKLDSASYSYGILLGGQLKQMIGQDYNSEMVMAALNSTLRGETTAISDADARTIYQGYAAVVQAKAAERAQAEGQVARAAGEKFLAENKKRPGIMTTASGLQYEVMKKGTATQSPTASDKVKVHYHGTNVDGSVFDSSVERGEPISFGLSQVIAGWTEGLQLMHPGDKFKFYIPSDLAYGERSPSPKIKPYSVLIFEVELFEINPKE